MDENDHFKDQEPIGLNDDAINEEEEQVYPDYVIEGVKRALEEAKAGLGKPYTGIKDMLRDDQR